MTRRLATLIGIEVALALLIGAGLWFWFNPFGTSGQGDASVPIGGSFSLVNQDGHPVTQDSFAGKWMLVYFGYTFCPDACPLGLNTIAEAMDQLPSSLTDEIVPVLVTVDPERDTPAVLKDYVGAFSPRLIGLTGTPDQVASALKSWRVYARKGELQPDGSYLVDHSTFTYLMAPDGKYAAHFSHDVTPEQMAEKLRATVGG
jgi:protein SCO1/2